MLTINSIKNGIVIDHIEPGIGIFIYKYLKLDEVDYPVALITNAHSDSMGKKDIIKIENILDLDLDAIGFIDPTITINYIEDEKVTDKLNLELPDTVDEIIKCKNPRCITSDEPYMVHRFKLLDDQTYACIYCDTIYTTSDKYEYIKNYQENR